jgi:hypothetical protein
MINRESAIFCAAALAASLVASGVGFSLAALPREAVKAPAETLPDIDLGGGFGRVSVMDLVGYYIENPPAGGAADAVPAARRFGGC